MCHSRPEHFDFSVASHTTFTMLPSLLFHIVPRIIKVHDSFSSFSLIFESSHLSSVGKCFHVSSLLSCVPTYPLRLCLDFWYAFLAPCFVLPLAPAALLVPSATPSVVFIVTNSCFTPRFPARLDWEGWGWTVLVSLLCLQRSTPPCTA